MGYRTLFVCDNCYRPPNGDSPDCVYSHESYPTHCDCAIHDLCDACMSKWRYRLAMNKKPKLYKHKPEIDKFTCPRCYSDYKNEQRRKPESGAAQS